MNSEKDRYILAILENYYQHLEMREKIELMIRELEKFFEDNNIQYKLDDKK